jgi:hypothetical protein
MKPHRYKKLGPLHDLLLKACPPDIEGNVSIPRLAEMLEMSSWGIYKWIRAGKIPPTQVVRIVDVSQGRVSISDFSPFVFL